MVKSLRLSKFAGAVAIVALLSGVAPALAASQTITGTVTAQQPQEMTVNTGSGSQTVNTAGAAVSGGQVKQGAKVQATGTMEGRVFRAEQVRVLV